MFSSFYRYIGIEPRKTSDSRLGLSALLVLTDSLAQTFSSDERSALHVARATRKKKEARKYYPFSRQ